ncbi:MAG: glycoside hydrolase family 127 protein, partial [Anaerolineae bacterium]|nr:glycoside hydrolase family 127 protein [Anaerolineae bacterium]
MKALPYAKFANLPVGSNLPQGWVQEFLTRQCDGITSHPATAGFPYGAKFWGAPSGDTTGTFSAWWPYEQTAYWLDGAVRAGALANRPDVLGMAAEEIDAAIQYAAPDGFIGPEEFRERDRWPYAVFFRALQALYETTGEERYLEALAAHYRGKPHPMGWNRDVTGVEPMIYLFAETRDPAFLEMALDLYRRFNEQCAGEDTALATLASDKKAGEHGVTFNEIAKLAALLYSATGEAVYRDAVVHAYARVDRDSRLADGLHSCSEHIRGRDSLDCHEACDITDHTWALGYLIQATGDARYADTIEQVIFNALPGQVTKDFHALQYLSSANQVVADTHSNHNLFQRGFNWMQYRPDMQVQCCPGNVQRALPNFSVLQWMSAPDGLAAVLYAPSRLTASLGALETPVEIVTETAYPFEETVRMRIDTPKAVEFTLWLRLPAWCAAPELSINGQAVHDLKPGAFVPVQRAWQSGDTVELRLPFALRVERWPDNGISLCYGPLTLALPIQARAEVEEGNSTLDQQILTMGDRYVE